MFFCYNQNVKNKFFLSLLVVTACFLSSPNDLNASVLYSNNFDSETTGSVPSGWTNIGAATWKVGTTSPISGTKDLEDPVFNVGGTAIYTGTSAILDSKAQITQTVKLDGSNNGANTAVFLRATSDGANGYLFAPSFGRQTLIVYKKVAGVFTKLNGSDGTSLGRTFVNNDTAYVKAQVSGSTISWKVWKSTESEPVSWTENISDSAITSSGYLGIFEGYNFTDNAGTISTFDDLVYENVPMTVGAISVSSRSNTSISLTTTATVGGSAPYTYQWYRSTTSGFTPGAGNILSGKTSSTLTDTGLTPSTTYYYKFTVTDSLSEVATSSEFTTSTTATVQETITYSGGYTIHTFTSSGTFTSDVPRNVEVLVVAGGGGGAGGKSGVSNGGGGGAGGYIYNSSYSVSGSVSVTVGAGGAGGNNTLPSSGTNGENSVFDTLTAVGGGGGGSTGNGNAGGSGGGAGGVATTKTGGAATSGQGFKGGDNTTASYAPGGGGGSSAAGQNNRVTTMGGGGAGTVSSINGSAVTYAKGGDAIASTIVNGTANTGNGGSGGYSVGSYAGGNGGSGVVIVRYLSPSATSFTLSGPSSGSLNDASSSFTVSPNGTYVGTITPITSGAGTFSPSSLTWTGDASPKTFTYTPTTTSGSPHSIGANSSPSLTNSSGSISFTVNPARTLITVDNTDWVSGRSPYNWYSVGSSYIQSVNPGSYFKVNFSGTSVYMKVDVSAISAASVIAKSYPRIYYQVDGGSWQTYQLQSSDTSIPLATSLSDSVHNLQVIFLSSDAYTTKWDGTMSLKITGLTLDSGKILSPATLLPKKMIFFGDSITEGAWVLGNHTDLTDYSNYEMATASWIVPVASGLNAEYGNVGFGGQSWSQAWVQLPSLPNAWNYYFSTNSRLTGGLFSPAPDYVVENIGHNDPSLTQSIVTNWFTSLRAATGPTTKIFAVLPFTGSVNTTITNGFNAYVSASSDTKAYLINLGSNGTTYSATIPTYSYDGSHPNVAGDAQLGALVLAQIQSILLSDAKTAAHNALTVALATYTQSNYSPSNWTTLTGFKTSGDTAIDNATNTTDVTTAQTTAINGMSGVQTIAQTTLSDAKTAAHNALTVALATYTQGNYSPSNWTTLTGFKTSGDTAIDNATNTTDVTTAQTTAINGMSGVQTIAQETPQVVVRSSGYYPGAWSGFERNDNANSISSANLEKLKSTHTLNYKTTNSNVKILQMYLNTHGFPVSKTGTGSKNNETSYFGLKTKQALIKFQIANGLKGDGILGKKTLEKMK